MQNLYARDLEEQEDKNAELKASLTKSLSEMTLAQFEEAIKLQL